MMDSKMTGCLAASMFPHLFMGKNKQNYSIVLVDANLKC